MVTLYDAPADELIDALAATLAERLEEPEWASFTKTGTDRELPPEQEDFWFRRAASILRKVAMDGPVGVEALSTAYGNTKRGSNRYSVAPAHKTDASKKVIRTILQQLEDEDLVSQEGSAGRIATPAGRSLLDETAGEVIEELDNPELERYV
ncbi:Ribosomal protein S19E (S16A) [Halanaeroarchaeum sp. HSR-CO]|uniref:30S ribosomal protein S19e n=1 Tax=Halanaeroarchaeum sp. HSR-CO TaxID=2866382 RepID=UPI00217D2C1B|nr:30S ribosomal protein S19e [Halanaeroarchaeum sp. HSR-CO]UWG46626.1 Ribosomal protein S19E (S16A) [Halanaeroarchaeum sp. HSR-CO]